MRIRRPLILIVALAALALSAGPAGAFKIVPVHIHDNAECNTSAWSWTACGHISNETQTITGPGTVGPAALTYLTSIGNGCADLFDVSRTIPINATRGVQAGGSFLTSCSSGTFVYELDAKDYAPERPLLAAVHIGKRVDPKDGSKYQELNECVDQEYIWCEITRVFDTGRDTQVDVRLTTRPLLVQVVNNTPNPLQRISYGKVTRGLAPSLNGDNMYQPIPPGGSAWMGGLRRTGASSCPTDAATGKPEADCVATKLGHSTLGAVLRFGPIGGAAPDYAGAELSFSVRVRTDGTHASRCTPLYRPTLSPLTCSVEFGGSNEGVTTATVTVKSAGA